MYKKEKGGLFTELTLCSSIEVMYSLKFLKNVAKCI